MMYITNSEIIENVLADATYACAHWIQQIETSIPLTKLNGECVEDKWFDCLSKRGKLIIIDNEDYEKHFVDMKALSRATSVVRKWPGFKNEASWDGTFADSIMQIAVFNELVFD